MPGPHRPKYRAPADHSRPDSRRRPHRGSPRDLKRKIHSCGHGIGAFPRPRTADAPALRRAVITDPLAAVLTRLHLGRPQDLAAVCAQALGVDGVALSLAVAGRGPEAVWSFSEASTVVEDLQFTLGQGPGPDSARTGATVTVRDLLAVDSGRWPELRAAIAEMNLPVRALYCFPLSLGAINVGVLTLARTLPGSLLPWQFGDAQALAAALTAWYLGGVGAELRPEPDSTPPLELNRAEVHQATGMLSVQLNVPLEQALLRLRAHAYAHTRPLRDVAADVVARRLRLSPDPDPLSAPDHREE